MPTPKKIDSVSELKSKFEKAVTVVVADYKGLTVEEITNLRKKFRENGIEYLVAKNTLIRKAIAELEFPNLDEFLKGPTAIAISYGDPVAPVKIATDFIKDLHKDRKFFEIKTSVLEGKVLSLEEVKTLSETPSREELLTRLVSAFNSPIQGFVNVCAGPLKNFVNVINAIKEQKEA
ncbi:MAG: 50S ribosomal protein L10 [Candidatus Muirbacterium halophilum]|nr:50S ribosomal protein L10 [Candidatus Muirbacterium halophilum]MCK9477118.1 50S ribosomal protein L10 [Candidatus Muirbacterium halophilum]